MAPSDVALRAQAMRNYARTGNAAYILFQDRHLLSVADRDGDTYVVDCHCVVPMIIIVDHWLVSVKDQALDYAVQLSTINQNYIQICHIFFLFCFN